MNLILPNDLTEILKEKNKPLTIGTFYEVRG